MENVRQIYRKTIKKHQNRKMLLHNAREEQDEKFNTTHFPRSSNKNNLTHKSLVGKFCANWIEKEE